jgi:DNA-binding beta-propeller fold protein YncE
VTSEAQAGPGSEPVQPPGCGSNPDASVGDLRAVSIADAEHDPAKAVRSVAPAASSPVRVELSDAGQLAWVTARGSDALLGFGTARLQSGKTSLVADVPVGSAPVGVILVGNDRWAVVADSNRFSGGNSSQWLSVVSIPAALAGQPALAGQIRAGAFPRQFALSPDGQTLYVTNFSSRQLETISVPALVRAAGQRP